MRPCGEQPTPALIRIGKALAGSRAVALLFLAGWDDGSGHGHSVGMAKPSEEIWEQREALGQRPWHKASLSLRHWQSWAAVPIWAGVHIWAVVPPGCCCRQSPAFAYSPLIWQQPGPGCGEAVGSLSTEPGLVQNSAGPVTRRGQHSRAITEEHLSCRQPSN